MLHFDLVSMLFGTSIPTSFNLLDFIILGWDGENLPALPLLDSDNYHLLYYKNELTILCLSIDIIDT